MSGRIEQGTAIFCIAGIRPSTRISIRQLVIAEHMCNRKRFVQWRKKNNKKQNFAASPMENNFSSCFTIQFIYMFLLTYNRVYAFFMLYLCLIHLVRDAKNSFVLIRNSLTDMFEMFVGGELASTIGWVIDKIGSMTKYFIYFATYLNFTSLTTSVGDFDCL